MSRLHLLTALTLAGLATVPSALAAEELVELREDFARDPDWEGRNNVADPEGCVEVVQDFGHSASSHAGGKERGEIGGRIRRSLTPASYASVLAVERSLEDRLRASGRFSVSRSEGGSGVLIGWFHHDSRGWRTPNSLVFRIDGEANSFRVFFEYGTGGWKTGGGQTFEGAYQTSRTSLLPADGKPHDFVLEYEPTGAGGRGEMRFTLDGKTYTAALAPGHRAEGARFDRFGILNQQTSGDALTLWLDDLEIDGRRESFSEDPGWEARGSRTTFTDCRVRGVHSVGHRDSSAAGGEAGEIGGYVWRVESDRPERACHYGAPVGRLSLRDRLRASGKFSLHHGSADSALLLGWFNSRTAIGAPPDNFLGVLVEGPSRVGHYFRPVYGASDGSSELRSRGPIIRPDGESHHWTLDYDPAAGEHGSITVGLDGEEVKLEVGAAARRADASFDRFGVVSWQRGGHLVEFYIDDLSYTARLPAYLAQKRPWTTSRVHGTPEPPLPYRSERIFPQVAFEKPVVITSAPAGDRIYVAEQGGKLFSFPWERRDGTADLFADLRKRIPSLTNVYGLTFHPDFAKSPRVYVCYTRGGDAEKGTVVSSFGVRAGEAPTLDLASERPIITWLAGGHNGGCLKFGPDGYLYISTGDGTGPYPPDGLDTGQDNSDLLSAILRIDVDVTEGYRVPADNPFVAMKSERPEIWAYGFRNPWKMSFDPQTGDLWVGDVGWELFEMVYRVERGGNYGWSVTEGRHPIQLERRRGPTPILPPVVEHSHSESRSITGGLVYRGKALPELRGAYIYGDYDTRKIWELRWDGEKPSSRRELAESRVRIVAFGESPGDHELLVLDYDAGTIHRLVPNERASEAVAGFPRRLSQTGLFRGLPRLVPEDGVVPYEIVEEPWRDGATADRHAALPGGSAIRVAGDRLSFPEGAVLVKTLSLPPALAPVDSSPARSGEPWRVETQILHREAEIWRAYTYAWNDEQTDAELVEASGRQVSIQIRDPRSPGGSSRLAWRFASRGECIVCHNFFTGTVLGFRLDRLDRERGDSGVPRGQLSLLQRVGVLEGRLPRRRGKKVDSRLARAEDGFESLEQRARAYLDINCSHCHQRNAGGSTLIDLRSELDLEATRCLDLRPLQGGLGIDQARIVFPGDSSRSVLYCRMASAGPAHMPHLGSNRIDVEGLELIRRWIDGLGARVPELPDLEDDSRALEKRQRQLCRVLQDRKEPRAKREECLLSLLATTSGALKVLKRIDAGVLDAGLSERAVAIALESPSPHVRDLYRRFVPDTSPRDTLGVGFAPSLVLELAGDVERGRRLYAAGEVARCKTCHRLPGETGTLGPDLAAAIRAKDYDRAALLQTIVEPSRSIDPPYRLHLVVTRDGESYTGFLVESGEETRLRDVQGEERRIPTSRIQVSLPQARSAMPELLLKDFTAQQAADLLEYLLSLKEE